MDDIVRSLAGAVVQAAGLLAVAPLLRGGIKKMKARMQTRKGPPLLQGYYDLAKLLQKETVRSETASWVYALGPRVYFAAAVAATTLVPVLIAAAPLEGAGGILGLVGMLALGRSASGVVVRGIDPAAAGGVVNLERHLEGGSLAGLAASHAITLPPEEGGSRVELPGILIGAELARSLGVGVSDVVSLISPLGTPGPAGMVPRVKRFVNIDYPIPEALTHSKGKVTVRFVTRGGSVLVYEGRMLKAETGAEARK